MSRPFVLLSAWLLVSVVLWGEDSVPPPDVDPVWMSFRKGEYETALKHYAEVCKDCRAAPSGRIVEYTQVLLEVGRHEEARAVCEEFLKHHPGEARVRARLGEVLYETGALETAEEAFRLALKTSPDSVLAKFGLAMVHRATGRDKEATAQFQDLCDAYYAQRPEDPESLLTYGFALQQTNRPHQALDLFVKATKHAPDPTDGRLASGFLFLSKGQVNDAAGEFRPILKQNPRNPFAHVGMAGCYFQDGKFPKVTEECDAALEVNPNLVEALATLADLETHDEDYAQATSLLERALKVNPSNVRVRTRLATVHYLKKDLESYERERKAVMDVHPSYAEFYRSLGSAAERLSRHGVAQQFFEKAHQIAPGSWQVLESLGFFYCRIGKEEEAYEILEKSFEGNRFNRRVYNLLQTLDYMEDFVSEENEDFRLRVHRKKDSCLVGYAMDYLRRAKARLEEQYGLSIKSRVIVEMFPRHDFFAARVHGLPGIGLNGVCFGKVVAMDSPRVAPGQFNWKEVLEHEFSHTMTLAATEHQIPRWLTEGLAVYDEQLERRYVQDQMLVSAWKKGELIPLDKLNRAFTRPRTRTEVLLAYIQSELAAEYLIKTHGIAKLRQVLAGLREGKEMADLVPGLLGQTMKEFSDAVLAYTASVAASIPLSPQYGPQDLEALCKAATASPKDANARAEYAFGLLAAEKRSEAKREAQAARELDPACALAERVLAAVAFSEEDYEPAEKHARKSIALNPRPMGPHLRLALVARAQGKPDEALESLRNAAARYARFPVIYQQMEELADQTKDTKARLEALEGMLKCGPAAVSAAQKLIKVYAAVDRHEDVERVARVLLQYNPYFVETHEALGQAHEAQGKPDLAGQEYLICIQLKPRQIENHLRLAKLLLAQDKKLEAKRVLLEAQKVDRKNEEVRQMLEELER